MIKSKSATSQVKVQKPILTEGRLEYLSLIALGLSNTEIGKILCVEENTVKKTLEEIAQLYGVSRERVRQIENRAISKLKKFCLREEDPEFVENLKNYF